MFIGLKMQIGKIHNSSLDTTHFACNLIFIFDEHFTFLVQILSGLNCKGKLIYRIALLPVTFIDHISKNIAYIIYASRCPSAVAEVLGFFCF